MSSDLDLYDHRVLQMADSNHQPQEEWPTKFSVVVVCQQCGNPWPCEVRKRVDEIQAELDREADAPTKPPVRVL